MPKVVVNRQFGGFGLSDAAYERLAELGIPVREYIEPVRGEEGRYIEPDSNKGRVIFDGSLEETNELRQSMSTLRGTKYWDTWTRDYENRSDPLVVQIVEELGEAANGRFSQLEVVTIPDGAEWTIEEYDGKEWVAESHRTW